MSVLIKLKLAIKGQKRIAEASPIIVSITQLTCYDPPAGKGKNKARKRAVGWGTEADPFPGQVEITLLERDTWTGGDDVVADDAVARDAIKDDIIISIPGTFSLTPESKKGITFNPDEAALAKAVAAVKAATTDRAWFNFDGRTGAPFEVPIPKNKEEGDETHFYEFSAVITSLPAGVEKLSEDAGVVAVRRPRHRHRMLAVEPLAQSSTSSSSKLLGVILDAFHPKAKGPERKDLKDRNWSRFMLRRTDEHVFQSLLVSSGCSLIVTTMILRYLHEPSPSGPISVYDKIIGPMIKDKSFDTKFAPRELVHDNAASLKAASGVYSGKKKKGEREALQAYLDENGLSTDPDFFGIDFKIEKLSDTKPEGQAFVCPANLTEHSYYYPIMVLWYIRQKQGSNDVYDPEVLTARKQVLVEKDGTTSLELEPVEYTAKKESHPARIVRPAVAARDTTKDTYYAHKKGYTFPFSNDMKKDFGISSSSHELKDLGAGWTDFVKKTIDDGLPLVAIMSPGVYTAAVGLAGTSGHWVVIAGYRTDEDGTVRFIINDPARSGAVQYDALYEDQLEDWLMPALKVVADARNEKNEATNKKKGKSLKTDYTAQDLHDEYVKPRERQGHNLLLDRRKFLTPRVFHVIKTKGWDPSHAKILEYDGRSSWKDVSPTAIVANKRGAADDEETMDDE